MSIQKEMNLKLIEKFQELKDNYEQEVCWQDKDETGAHTVYGDVFTPFIEKNIDNQDDKKIIEICNFIEELLSINDEYIENVICLSVLERIIDNKANLEYFEKFAKENTKSEIKKMISINVKEKNRKEIR